ncbi:MAG: SGNH hydrolase domain-containing protein, partial [Actinomycetes bacterium]
CLSGYLDDVQACTPQRSAAVNESGIVAETAAAEASGGHYADTTDLFCTAARCPVIVGDTLVYVDDNHMTLEYARTLAPAIGALADRALAHG